MIAFIEDECVKKEKLVSVKELSEKLSISVATVKNWIKLNKIHPSVIKNNKFFFTENYTNNLLQILKSKNSNILKSRRNKNYISGNCFYKDYVSNTSKNINIISELLNYIESNNYSLSTQVIKYLIADCAIQLLLQSKKINSDIDNNLLLKYLKKNFSLEKYSELIDDLIDDKNLALEFVKNYQNIFKKYSYEPNEDILGLLYISLANLNNRKASGTYYTPTNIVKKIITQINFNSFTNKKIIDPACGTGNFLLQLPQNINIEQIYGNDIDEIAIKIARLNMALKFEINDPKILYKNFTNKNFLLDNSTSKFDYIIGNPPWGAKFDIDTVNKLKIKYLTAQNKNIDSYDIFIEKSLSCLDSNGNLLFVLPKSMLTVKNHQTIRNIILNTSSIKSIEFLGNMFDRVNCPSIILNLQCANKFSTVGLKVINKDNTFIINKERVTTPVAFSFSMNDKEYSVFNKILTQDNKVFLKNNANFALGIVTGDNKKYINNKKTNSNEPILKGTDIEKFTIKKPVSYIEFNPQNFQQVAPTKIYRAKEKLFYKFISNRLIFAYDNNQTLSLNSCNILIPQVEGLDIKYIMAILNSRIAQFIFEKKYNSVKVLRTHIENIPIPICKEDKQQEIINIVDKILDKGFTNSNELYETLEEKICKLYNLNSEEYKIITY